MLPEAARARSCNATGSQTEVVFDGGSLAFDAKGNVVKELKYFEEDYAVIDTKDLFSPQTHKQDSRFAEKEFDKEMRVSKINDPDKIMWTYDHILPNFLDEAVGAVVQRA